MLNSEHLPSRDDDDLLHEHANAPVVECFSLRSFAINDYGFTPFKHDECSLLLEESFGEAVMLILTEVVEDVLSVLDGLEPRVGCEDHAVSAHHAGGVGQTVQETDHRLQRSESLISLLSFLRDGRRDGGAAPSALTEDCSEDVEHFLALGRSVTRSQVLHLVNSQRSDSKAICLP